MLGDHLGFQVVGAAPGGQQDQHQEEYPKSPPVAAFLLPGRQALRPPGRGFQHLGLVDVWSPRRRSGSPSGNRHGRFGGAGVSPDGLALNESHQVLVEGSRGVVALLWILGDGLHDYRL